jgi:drug/metabolite transporter (DMT)-like permease
MSAVLGICIGFLGVYFLMFDKVSGESTHVVLPTLAVMLATTCYGISASYTKKYLEGLSSLALATGSQVGATFLLLPISLFFLPENIPSSNAVLSVITLGIMCTAIAYVLFFRLIKAVGPTKTISVTYLIPVFGIAWGMIFLGETINQWTILGAGLILFGISLTTGIIKSTAINNLFSLKKD